MQLALVLGLIELGVCSSVGPWNAVPMPLHTFQSHQLYHTFHYANYLLLSCPSVWYT